MKRPASAASSSVQVLKRPASAPKPIKQDYALDLQSFMNAVTDKAFTSNSSIFLKLRMQAFPETDKSKTPTVTEDCLPIRALMAFGKHGAIHTFKKCGDCKKHGARFVQFKESRSEGVKYHWVCAGYKGKACWQRSAAMGSVLEGLANKCWFPFLHFVTLMTSGERMKCIYQEIEDAYDIRQQVVDVWKQKYLVCLKVYLEKVDGPMVGNIAEVISVDESTMTRDMSNAAKPMGFKTKPRRMGSNSANKVKTRTLPGRTIWKRPASGKTKRTMRKPASAMKKVCRRPAADKRSSSRWLWTAVECGQKDGVKKSHKLKNKRVVIRMLPRKKDAIKGQPRGKDSLAAVFKKHVRKGSEGELFT